MFVPVICISIFPTKIILCEDEIEWKSTSFTSTFGLEKIDEDFSSSVVGGSLAVLAHSPTYFLTYPSPA